MVYKLITEPTELAVTLAEAKAQLNIDPSFTADDTLITACINASALYIEKIIQSPLMNQTWELQLVDFTETIKIWKTPLSSITSVSYYDVNEADQTVSNSNYYTDLASVPARIIFKSNYDAPTVFDTRFDAVRIRFVSGYVNAASVPADIKEVVKLLVTHFYENRSPEVVGTVVNKFSLTVEKLLHGYIPFL
jgi:uncharacterized phiE125 gp8 family phage protein